MFRPGKPPYFMPPFGPSPTPGSRYGGPLPPPPYVQAAPCGPFPARPEVERHYLPNRPTGMFQRVRITLLSPCFRVAKWGTPMKRKRPLVRTFSEDPGEHPIEDLRWGPLFGVWSWCSDTVPQWWERWKISCSLMHLLACVEMCSASHQNCSFLIKRLSTRKRRLAVCVKSNINNNVCTHV